MPRPIALVQDAERAVAVHARAVRRAGDDTVESWDLELWGGSPARILASDSYSLNRPVAHEDLMELLSFVLSRSGLQLGPSTLRNASTDVHDFVAPVAPIF